MTVVGPEGPPDAKVVIVGEAPGSSETAAGRPFVGASGQLLNSMLSSSGIDRSRCYVTNVVKVQPPRNDFGIYYKDKKKTEPTPVLEESIRQLRQEISIIKPNVVLALGNEPLKALTGKTGITKWRGSILPTRIGTHECKVIPSLHPAYILRVYKDRVIGEIDMRRVVREQDTPIAAVRKYKFILEPEFEETMSWLQKTLKNKPTLSFDIETMGKHTRCLGFAWSSLEAICIPFMSSRVRASQGNFLSLDSTGSPQRNHWNLEEENALLPLLSNIFSDPEIPMIAQNFPFDSTILGMEYGFHSHGLIMDTMVAHHCCYSELPKSLDFLCSMYTEVPRYSDYNPADDLSLWQYNCMDVCVTFEVAEKLTDEMTRLGVKEFYENHVQPTMLALTEAQNRGIAIDEKWAQHMRETHEKSTAVTQVLLDEKVGHALNANSPKKVMEYLYQEKRIPPVIKRTTKKPTADEEALDSISVKFPLVAEECEWILKIRKNIKLVSQVLDAVRSHDGTMPTTYNVCGTVNGRLSSQMNIFAEGLNIQQVHKNPVRKMFVARTGYVFLRCDLSQAEARAVAWLGHIRALVDRFQDHSWDIHTWNAAENLFGVAEADVTFEQREMSKASVHGGNYRLGNKKAAVMNKISFSDAKHALESYRRALPELAVWWAQVWAGVGATRTLRTPMGRRRAFLDRLGDEGGDTHRSAIAFEPQALVGDIINRAFHIGAICLEPFDSWPLLQIHDEIVFEVLKRHVAVCVPIIRALMEYPIIVEGESALLIIPAEIELGPNWYDQEEYNDQSC